MTAPRGLTLGSVDQLLGAWDERLSRIDDNLLALEGDSTYQLLSGAVGAPARLEGVTKAQVAPALEALAQLFEQRQRLADILARAKEVRASISALAFWERDEKLAEIDGLLNGPSIHIGTKPLALRTLLDTDARDVAIAPEALLAGMAGAYDVARDAVIAVSRAWAELAPAMEAATREIGALRTENEIAPEAPVAADLDQIERDLARLQVRIVCDPLGVRESVSCAIEPRLAGLRAQLRAAGERRAHVEALLAQGVHLERELLATHASAVRSHAAAVREFDDGVQRVPAPIDRALVEGLGPWMLKLQSTIRAGRWSAAQVGLERWLEVAHGYLAADREVASAFDELAARRAELAGRLSARAAQARALTDRGQHLDAGVDAKRLEAQALLRAVPVSLAAVAASVDAFERGVVAAAERARRGG